jgi:hypothetical protein
MTGFLSAPLSDGIVTSTTPSRVFAFIFLASTPQAARRSALSDSRI